MDYGHLPRWKKYSGGRVLLREDRVDMRTIPDGTVFSGYTNVNPKLRSYWLDKDAKIYVGGYDYFRITGHYPAPHWNFTYQVSRQQFLDSFNTRGVELHRCIKYTAVYALVFDRSHAHVRQIEQLDVDSARIINCL